MFWKAVADSWLERFYLNSPGNPICHCHSSRLRFLGIRKLYDVSGPSPTALVNHFMGIREVEAEYETKTCAPYMEVFGTIFILFLINLTLNAIYNTRPCSTLREN